MGVSIWTEAVRLRARWRQWRNRLIASPAFQRRAAAFPLTRPIARAQAKALFDLTAGFVYSQVAVALVESGLLTALAEGPLSLETAAAKTGLPPDAARTLLRAAHGLKLVAPIEDGQWSLGARGAALAGSPGVVEMIRHHRLFYADLADPVAMLRGQSEGRLAALWRYGADSDPETVAAYSALMAASQPMIAAQALAAYDFGRHEALLDVGGGSGAFLAAVGANHPGLRLGLFDLAPVPGPVAAIARHSGDFRIDRLPEGYDLVSLVRVLHDHDDAPAAHLLRAIHAALPTHGRLLIVEPMAGNGGAGPYFEFYLAAMGSGRLRTAGEIAEMLREAGFRGVRQMPTPLPLVASAIVGVKTN